MSVPALTFVYKVVLSALLESHFDPFPTKEASLMGLTIGALVPILSSLIPLF